MDIRKHVAYSKTGTNGCLWLLVDAAYSGQVIVPTKTGDRKFHYLLLLFGRIKKDGESVTKWRQLTISTKDEATEFNKFWKGYSGKAYVPEDGVFINFEEFSKEFVEEVQANDFNFRLQFNPSDKFKVDTIGSISKLKIPLITKQPGMLWHLTAIQKYPFLKRNNEELSKFYSSLKSKGGASSAR